EKNCHFRSNLGGLGPHGLVLLEHFHICEGWSIPRGLMYQFYLEYCNHSTSNPINAATFGKVCSVRFTMVADVYYKHCQDILQHIRSNRFDKMIEEVLLRDFLADFSVQHLQSARSFAKKFKSWLVDALEGTPLLLQTFKMRGIILYILCLFQSMHVVLNNRRMVSTLKADLNSMLTQGLLDIPSKPKQSVSCPLDEIGNSFEWKCNNFRGEEFIQLAANFQLRWNYFLSAISRALTLSNAESFGSWHLVNLLISEYLTHVLQSYMEEEMDKPAQEGTEQLPHEIVQEPDFETVLDTYSAPSESPNINSDQFSDQDLNLQNITIKPLGFEVDALTGNKVIQVLVEDEATKSVLKLSLPIGKKAVVTLKNGQMFEIHTSKMQQNITGDMQA
uniref:Uncharacterized protein n=1 Tax=Callorhinchus milii TaxID=7868 RepID=A0A4W3JF78_CALMI